MPNAQSKSCEILIFHLCLPRSSFLPILKLNSANHSWEQNMEYPLNVRDFIAHIFVDDRIECALYLVAVGYSRIKRNRMVVCLPESNNVQIWSSF